MLDLLGAAGPAPELAARDPLFARLIGSWKLDMVLHESGGAAREFSGDWHFGWVLDGRAIQDVLVATPGPEAGGGTKRGGLGTTLRVYAPERDAWVVLFADPQDGEFNLLIARDVDDRIVQEGRWSLEEPDRTFEWTFFDISPDSFRWEGKTSPDGGTSWRLTQEIAARRVR